jgi:hypothetical protein
LLTCRTPASREQAPTIAPTAPAVGARAFGRYAPQQPQLWEPAPEPECDKLSKADLKAIKFIARDKKIDISAGVALPLPEELQEFNGLTLTWVIALETADAGIPIFAHRRRPNRVRRRRQGRDQAFPRAGGFDHQVGAAKSSGS